MDSFFSRGFFRAAFYLPPPPPPRPPPPPPVPPPPPPPPRPPPPPPRPAGMKGLLTAPPPFAAPFVSTSSPLTTSSLRSRPLRTWTFVSLFRPVVIFFSTRESPTLTQTKA